MKEATGELNATLVVVLTIGVLSTFFFTVIWPQLKTNLNSKTRCSDAVCPTTCDENTRKCTPNWADSEHRTVKCIYKRNSDDQGTEIVCPYKG
jgi:hypothetical protein